ncbi:recombinase [Bacillus sp. FMQ74]|uniref:recombinase family protein n=1 Tax=Bacillus sp. FMQ74 TaxID=1913579 RepID=UPI0008FB8DCA|nr:recombinase family protein [Bacillus sp. FMQ74]OIR59259.1 recombinase [Bacillus sp. FMQ74]
MKIGYARVSTEEQKLERQLDALNEAGCERIFLEKITGTKRNRPELDKLLNILREGDVVIISDLTRLGRSTNDLITIVNEIKERGADLKSLKETWLDTTTPQGKLMFTIFSGLAEFERDLIVQRTKEGLEAAKRRGVKVGRKPAEKDKVELLFKLYDSKQYTIKEIMTATGLSKPTVFRYLRKRKSGTLS